MRTPKVSKVTGATFRQLDYWARLGLFGGEVTSKGSGSNREWDPVQVILAKALSLLSRLGASAKYGRLRRIEPALRALHATNPDLNDCWLILTEDRAFVSQGPFYATAGIVIDLSYCARAVLKAKEAS